MDSQKTNHSSRIVLCGIIVFIAVLLGGVFWMDQQNKKRQKDMEEMKQERVEAQKAYNDSTAADSLHGDACPATIEEESSKQLSGAGSGCGSRSYSDDDSDDEEEETRKHPGTSPDDGMFGFDYWDDEDDAYEMDRNQSDAYPDDW